MAKEKAVEAPEAPKAPEKDFVAIAIMEPGFLIIKSELRYGVKPSKDRSMLPPSDFFVVRAGDTHFPEGCEVVLKPGARMAPFKDMESIWIIEKTEINCSFPV